MKYFVYTYILFFPFLVNINFDISGFQPDEILILILFFLFIVSVFRKKHFKISPVDLIFFSIVLLGCYINILSCYGLNLGFSILSIFKISKLFILYCIFRFFCAGYFCKLHIFHLMLLVSLSVHFIALMQFLEIDYIVSTINNVYDYRSSVQNSLVSSIFGDKNTYGGYSLFLAVIASYLYEKRKKIQNLILLVVQVCGILLSGSSTAFVGLFICLYFYFIKNKSLKTKIYFLVVAFFLGCVFFFIFEDIIILQINRQFRGSVYSRTFDFMIDTHGIPASLFTRLVLSYFLLQHLSSSWFSFIGGFGFSDVAMEMLPWGTAETGYMSMFFHYGFFYMFSMILFWFYLIKSICKRNDIYEITGMLYCMLLLMFTLNFVFPYYQSTGSGFLFTLILAIAVSNKQKFSLNRLKKRNICNE